MKLCLISEDDKRAERRARIYNFPYRNHSKFGDPKPQALFLGGWWHPTTGNRLFGAINLNYLSAQQKDELQRALSQIFSPGNRGLKARAQAVEQLCPNIFHLAYRTYNRAHVSSVTTDMVHFVPAIEADKQLDPRGAETPPETTPEAPETTPEIPKVPEATPTQEVQKVAPEVAPEAPEAQDDPEMAGTPEIPVRDKVDTSTPAPPVPSALGVRPTSRQRREPTGTEQTIPTPGGSKAKQTAGRPSVQEKPPVQTPAGIITKSPEVGRPKPTSLQRRKGLWSTIKDKISSLGASARNLLTKWRKK